tara:strand:+ start:1212 stop:1538 length:327 start_codon:yes stop_codon:yes gene_type:complete
MKTITLKLTDAETKLLGTQRGLGNVQQILVSNPLSVDGKKWTEHTIEVLNVDKFRKFLNDEIDKCFPTDDNGMSEMLSAPNGAFYEGSESQKQDNLKSILSKLDEEGK